jgi:predicted peptidase
MKNCAIIFGTAICVVSLLGGQCLAGVVTADGGFSETWNGATLAWEKAVFTGQNASGTWDASIPFGLALPKDYAPTGQEKYPLVIYLHGDNGSGQNDSRNLTQQTARSFAHQAQTEVPYNAFVLSPQVPRGDKFVNVSYDRGPYEQSPGTSTDSMCLTEQLIGYLTGLENKAELGKTLGINPDDIDTNRLYIVGESMGAYGVWDTLGRGTIQYAGAIAVGGSGPINRLDAIVQTPLWAIHGKNDSTVPNYWTVNCHDVRSGTGTLAMLVQIDRTFDNTASTALVTLDNLAIAGDDPDASARLIYTQYPTGYGHADVATSWTVTTSGYSQWLFAQQVPEPATVLLLAIGGLAVLRKRAV